MRRLKTKKSLSAATSNKRTFSMEPIFSAPPLPPPPALRLLPLKRKKPALRMRDGVGKFFSRASMSELAIAEGHSGCLSVRLSITLVIHAKTN